MQEETISISILFFWWAENEKCDTSTFHGTRSEIKHDTDAAVKMKIPSLSYEMYISDIDTTT